MDANELRIARMAGCSAGSAVLGFLCGYLLHRHRSMVRFDKRVAEEVAAVQSYYRSRANMAGKGDHPCDAVSPLEEPDGNAEADGRNGKDDGAAEQARGERRADGRTAYHSVFVAKNPATPADLVVGGDEDPAGTDVGSSDEGEVEEDSYDADGRANIFDRRDTTRPYPITLAEFSEENPEYGKITITYYQQDQVLVDDKEVPIREVLATIGPDGLDFGVGSEDENIVYIRNERLRVDFEVTRDLRSYTEVVMGYGNPRLTARARQGEL